MAALTDPTIINVPSCASHISADDYDPNRAAAFDPFDPAYLEDLVPSAVGGFVLGALCVLCAAALALWLVVTALRQRTWQHDLEQVESGARVNIQLAGGSGSKAEVDWSCHGGDATSGGSTDQTSLRGWRAWLLLALTVAAVGAALWALVESVLSAHGSAGKFWGVIDDARDQLGTVLETSQALLSAAKDVRSALLLAWYSALSGSTALPAGTPANTTQLLQRSAQQFVPIILASDQSVARIQANGVEALSSFEDRFKGRTLRLQNFDFPIIAAVFYALLAVGCGLGALLGYRGRRPQLTGWLTVVMWLLAAFLLLFGAGVLHSGQTVSKDSCLYAEALSFSVARQRASGETLRQLQLGLRYYFRAADLPVSLVASLIYGLDFSAITKTLQLPEVKQVTTFLESEVGRAAIAAGRFNSTGAHLLASLPGNLDTLTSRSASLADQINVATFGRLYERAKVVLCCEWTDDIHGLFAAWTASGVATMALCAALSIRVHSQVVRPGLPGSLPARAWHFLHGLLTGGDDG